MLFLWLNRLQFFFFFSICFTLLLIQSKKCWDRYAKHETGVTLSILSSSEAIFPAFTLCPNFNHAYKEQFLRDRGISGAELKKGILPIPISGSDNMTMGAFYDLATYELEELVDYVDVGTLGWINTKKTSYKLLGGDTGGAEWSEMRTMTFGRCYSLELGQEVITQGISTIQFYFRDKPAYVFIHHPGQFTNTHGKLMTTLGQKMFVDVDFELTYLLGEDRLSRRDNSSFVCSDDMTFGYDRCIYGGLAVAQYLAVGCVGVRVRDQRFPSCQLAKTKSVLDSLREKELRVLSNCSLPCGTISYILGLPDHDSHAENASYLKLYFKSSIKVTRFAYAYEMLSLLGEIGGYSGLLLGISAYHLSYLIERCIRYLEYRHM